MGFNQYILGLLLIALGTIQYSSSQFIPLSAKVPNSMQNASLSKSTVLNCSSEPEVPLILCLWERINMRLPSEASGTNLIVTFNVLTSKPGLKSGTDGYTYQGNGLRKGHCGLKIESVQENDFKEWRCTLLGENNAFRGSISLNKGESDLQPLLGSKNFSVGSVSPVIVLNSLDPQSKRQSKQFEFSVGTGTVSETSPYQQQVQVKPRPIITVGSVGDSEFSRSISPPSEGSTGSQIQEVQVQSAGLVIIPKKSRKLIILE